MRARDRAGRVLVMPNQAPGLAIRVDLTRAELDRALWTVDPLGTRREGARAINHVLRLLPLPWRWPGRVLELPPLLNLEKIAYALVARNRHHLSRWWGTTPECAEPGVECD